MGRLVIDYPSHPDSIIVQKFAEHRDGVYTVLAKIRLDDAPHVVFGRNAIPIINWMPERRSDYRAWLSSGAVTSSSFAQMKMEEQ